MNLEFAMERNGRARLKPAAVFRVISEDWWSCVALIQIRERWPELNFMLKPAYLQPVCF